MAEEWDTYPVGGPPCYPVRFGDESAAENKRIDELCEQIRKDYERRCEEARRQWPKQRVESVQDRLKFLRLCQKAPGAEGPRLLRECVYLMWCPSLGVYKIGHTDCLWRRIDEHRRNLDPQIEHRAVYYTPLSRRLLERFLIGHFRHFRVRTDISEELFDLPQKEADGFDATTAVIEKHLLAVEILRLKALLSKFEDEFREAE